MSTIQQNELTVLLQLLEANARALLQAAKDAEGDFCEVEAALGEFILRLRPSLA